VDLTLRLAAQPAPTMIIRVLSPDRPPIVRHLTVTSE
jgi:hypothetical protein